MGVTLLRSLKLYISSAYVRASGGIPCLLNHYIFPKNKMRAMRRIGVQKVPDKLSEKCVTPSS